jgi:kinesin family protein 6/9
MQDVLDVGEKFERLQIERMAQEDPDSLPFYNAKKNYEKGKVKLSKKSSSKTLPVAARAK